MDSSYARIRTARSHEVWHLPHAILMTITGIRFAHDFALIYKEEATGGSYVQTAHNLDANYRTRISGYPDNLVADTLGCRNCDGNDKDVRCTRTEVTTVTHFARSD